MNKSTTDLKQESIVWGWVDILISCIATILLCIWSSICVNVPNEDYGFWDIIRDKWHMMFLGALGPEFILLLALGQYSCALNSCDAFKAAGYPVEYWTMRHAFFADMGGFILRPKDWKPFPINGKQLHYLVTYNRKNTDEKYLEFPRISKETIEDKNKASGLARFITVGQMLWFSISSIARLTQKLAITNLEITTLGNIVCALATAWVWRHKPMDVGAAVYLDCDYTIETILREADCSGAQAPYRFTPLDFVSREEWIGGLCWRYFCNILFKLHWFHKRPTIRPIQHFSSFNFPMPASGILAIMLPVSLAYSAVFVAAWNQHFPTPVERLLWRICSVGSMFIVLVAGGTELPLLFIKKWKGSRRKNADAEIANPSNALDNAPASSTKEQQRGFNRVLNNSPDKDPLCDVPLRGLLFITPLCAVYSFFRAFILIEDLVSIREQPGSTFKTVDWSAYLPHI